MLSFFLAIFRQPASDQVWPTPPDVGMGLALASQNWLGQPLEAIAIRCPPSLSNFVSSGANIQ